MSATEVEQSTILYAWFPQAGRLLVRVPEGQTAVAWRKKVMKSEWIEMEDGSWANVQQIIRLQVKGEGDE